MPVVTAANTPTSTGMSWAELGERAVSRESEQDSPVWPGPKFKWGL